MNRKENEINENKHNTNLCLMRDLASLLQWILVQNMLIYDANMYVYVNDYI